jgi:hypothetical protein
MYLSISFQSVCRTVVVFITSFFFYFSADAQIIIPDNIHVGLLYPISTHGTDAPSDTNIFSFNLLGGVSAEERSFTFAGVTNVIRNNASGFQFAGFSNHLGKKSKGFLFAGFANTYGQGKGFQTAGFSNVAREEVDGAQFACFLNKAENVKGAQFGGFSNLADKVEGSQFAGFINKSSGFKGSQFAGFINITANQSTGSQFAGFINKAGNIKGSQFAGFINIAKKVKGAQFGFINIADSSDCPFGLVNIIRKGEKSIGLSTDDNLTTLLSFRSGGKVLYGILGAGYNLKNTEEVYAFEAGLGAHFQVTNSFRINTELATIMLESFSKGEYFKSSFRLLPALKLARHVELFGGPVFNYVNTNTGEGKTLTSHYIQTWTNLNNNFEGIYIGYTGGVHFLF